jgi:ABC-2 type transport system permease protein
MRLLDKERVLKEKTFWQILNMVLPLILVIIMGIVFAVVRNRKYAR